MRAGHSIQRILFLLVTSIISDFTAAAPPIKRPPFKFQSFYNHGCRKSDSCSLKEFKIGTRQIEFTLQEYNERHHFVETVASYRTKKLSDIKDYAIVQFKRGCRFETYPENGAIHTRGYFGNYRSFGDRLEDRFKNWIIDSVDRNPIYFSYDDRDKFASNPHYGYYWNEKRGDFSKDNRHYFGEMLPPRPEIYIRDLDGPNYVANGAFFYDLAMNTWMQYKTCVYKTKDIPKVTTRDDIHFAKPIHCFDWGNFHVYDHFEKKWTSPNEMPAYCGQ